MSFLLVLAAAVTLVVGLLQSGLTLIYLSIGCSVVAGLVLAVAVLRGRPEPRAAASAPARPYSPPPEPAYSSTPSYSSSPFSSDPEPESADESWKVETPAPASRRFGRPAAIAVEEPDEAPDASLVAGYARRAAGAGASTAPSVISSEMPPMAARGAFPIPDFDDLRAPELLRRLDDLDAAGLEQVREREEAGKNRVSILSRIDARVEALREPGWEIDEATWEGGEAEAAADEPAGEADLDEGDDFEDEAQPEPEPQPEPADGFPIANYDALRVGQILPQLRDLGPAELDEVRQYEAAGKSRSGILDRIDFLAGGGTRPTVPAAAPPPAPARKVAAKKAAAPAAAPPEAPAAAPAAPGKSSIAAAVAAAKAKQAKKG